MKLHIENFAKIKKADIEINGITVIAGENNTGKSTIGKIIYCLYAVFKDLDIKVEYERKKSIVRALLGSTSIREKILSYMDERSSENIMDIVNEIFALNINEIALYLEKNGIDYTNDLIKDLQDAIEFNKDFLKSLIIKRQFSYEFNNQFLPLNGDTSLTKLDLYIKDKNNSIIFDDMVSINNELNLVKDCIYIDNPFSLDRMDLKENGEQFNIFDFILKGTSVFSHDTMLVKKLSKSLKNDNSDLIKDSLLDQKLTKFKNIIKEIVQGDFIEKEEKFVFYDSLTKNEIEIQNLSTGIKSFAILLKLLENRDITKDSIIILDEPEIHLHPNWQLKFAETLLLLQKEFDLNIIITSHSPYFVRAMEVYSAKYNVADKCKYYLADLDQEYKAFFEDVTTNTELIYEKLAEPFQILADEIYRLESND